MSELVYTRHMCQCTVWTTDTTRLSQRSDIVWYDNGVRPSTCAQQRRCARLETRDFLCFVGEIVKPYYALVKALLSEGVGMLESDEQGTLVIGNAETRP